MGGPHATRSTEQGELIDTQGCLEHEQLIVTMPSNKLSIVCLIMLNLSSAFIDVDFPH